MTMSIPEESPAPNQKNQQSQSDSQPRDLVDATFAALREAAAQRGFAPPLGTSQTGAQSFCVVVGKRELTGLEIHVCRQPLRHWAPPLQTSALILLVLILPAPLTPPAH